MTKKTRVITFIGVLFLAFIFAGSLSFGADTKIVVKVNTANIRLKPAMDSPIVGKARMGLTLTVMNKVQDWYFVEIPADKNAPAVRGYIHKSVVQEFIEEPPPPIKEAPTVKPKPAPLSEPVRPKAAKPVKSNATVKKIFLRIGAGYGMKSFDYTNNWLFTMYQEQGHISEKYSVDTSGLAIDVGIGYMLSSKLGLELSFAPVTGKSKGTFSADFPHPFYFNASRAKNWTAGDLNYSAYEINLDVLYALPMTSKIDIYFMGGGTYFMSVKVHTLKSITWTETGYPYLDLNITPNYPAYSASCIGFNAAGGVDYRMTPSLAVNVNVRYSSGTAKIKVDGREITVKPGGLKATAGVKFRF